MSSSNRQLVRQLLVAATVGAVLASILLTAFARQPSPATVSSSGGGGGGGRGGILPQQERPSTVKICNALHALREMHPESPSLVLSPLELLSLSTTDVALRDAGKASSAKAGSQANRALRAAILKSGNHVREPLWARCAWNKKKNKGGGVDGGGSDDCADGLAQRTIRASYVVSDMLLDNAARVEFLTKLQPKLGENGAVTLKHRLEAVDRFCAHAWKSRGW
ncbi:uncharacterized protein LY79DRAFT_674588 [Colletotrichum navitas]|uniref:Uncharacterized protein n=1 Tax=Colletotrichum navitas TaxID=681940 RepID=A0AAD8UZ86_9PEZI|nr:uncharacterized protein LY79DRAFT_674588 [Colletotrichum navitas]KAK1569554.1 hypothetical protein LY79DRAFT_674588 [Colletotrichum navitas]